MKEKHILFCKCGGERINNDILQIVEENLRELPVAVTCLSDLCGLVAQKKDLLSDLFTAGTEYMVIGCYRRTMDLLLSQIKKQDGNPLISKYINLIETSSDEAVEQINAFCSNQKGSGVRNNIAEDSGWPSWYPIIDYSRCTACGQCADFCLFGVYEKTENRINVQNPAGCKNNCPACARICPVTAIIFPKYRNGGAIGGSDEIDEQAEQQRQAQDIESFMGSDLYAALEKRKAKRQSIIREEAMKNAISERDNALRGLEN